jgi:hypothetical protein
VNETAGPVQKSLVTIGEIPRDLVHPLLFRLLDNPGDLHSAGLEIDDEENEISN